MTLYLLALMMAAPFVMAGCKENTEVIYIDHFPVQFEKGKTYMLKPSFAREYNAEAEAFRDNPK